MIFVTVGTVAPFDRLIRAADALAGATADHTWFAQIGTGDFEPKCMGFVRFLDKADFDQRVRCADFIVAHGGIGIISDVLKLRKPLLVLPRIARLGEHVNDHQVKTAQFYGENGYVLVARESDDFAEVFRRLQSFTPRRRTAQPGRVADRIGRFLRHFDEP